MEAETFFSLETRRPVVRPPAHARAHLPSPHDDEDPRALRVTHGDFDHTRRFLRRDPPPRPHRRREVREARASDVRARRPPLGVQPPPRSPGSRLPPQTQGTRVRQGAQGHAPPPRAARAAQGGAP